MSKSPRNLRVAIIGAGPSGICAAVKLRQIGITDIVIYEKADKVGGTWRDNIYPGLTCDVPSHLYRFSFAPNSHWTRRYAAQKEILEYLARVAEEFDINRVTRFSTEMTRAEWRDNKWHISSQHGDVDQFDAIISAVGVLHWPSVPDLEGLNDFSGPAFHTARWDSSLSLRGKRVGIIGTGATAAQIISEISDEVQHLTVFQRTAQWVLPLPNIEIDEEQRAAYQDNPELMQELYDFLTRAYNDDYAAAIVGKNPRVYAETKKACEDYLATVRDATLREKLTPAYEVGCKRLVVSSNFYDAMQKPSVSLVTSAIKAIRPTGVEMDDGTLHEIDILILATGFNAHRPFGDAEIIGEGGLKLDDAWSEGAFAYRCATVPQFPNFFMIGGPNSPIGNFSYIMTGERVAEYVTKLLDVLRDSEIASISPKKKSTDEYYLALREQMKNTIWASGCKSWYIDSHGRAATFPWEFAVFEEFMSKPILDHFELKYA